MRRWFQLYLRQFMKRPKDLARAALVKRRLAFFYLFFAWNALGLYLYKRIKETHPMTPAEEKIPALWYLRLIGEDKVQILSFDGLTQKSFVHFDAATDTITPITSDTIFGEDTTDEVKELKELDR